MPSRSARRQAYILPEFDALIFAIGFPETKFLKGVIDFMGVLGVFLVIGGIGLIGEIIYTGVGDMNGVILTTGQSWI